MMNSLYFNSCCCLRGPLSEPTDPCPEHGSVHTYKGVAPTSTEIYKALKDENLNRSDVWKHSEKLHAFSAKPAKDTFLFMAYFKLTLDESCNIKGKYFVPYKNKMRFAVPTNQIEIHVPNLGRNPDSIISEVLDNFELDQIDSLTITFSKIG